MNEDLDPPPADWSDWRHYVPAAALAEITPAELARRHLAELAAADSPSLWDWRTFYARFVRDFDPLPVRQHSPGIWLGWLRARNADRRKLAPKTLAKHLALASAAYERAREMGGLEVNPITLLPRKRRPKRRVRDPLRAPQCVLSIVELRQVVGVEGVPPRLFWARLFFGALLLTGLRFGEAAGLRFADYRQELGPLPGLSVQAAWHTKARRLRATKDGLARCVPVHPWLEQLLRQLPDRFGVAAGRAIEPGDPLLPFFAAKGAIRPRRWSQQTALRVWRGLLSELRIPDPPSGPRAVHATRHTFITRLAAAGVASAVIRAMTHPATARRAHADAHAGYAHVEPDWQALCEGVRTLGDAEQAQARSASWPS